MRIGVASGLWDAIRDVIRFAIMENCENIVYGQKHCKVRRHIMRKTWKRLRSIRREAITITGWVCN